MLDRAPAFGVTLTAAERHPLPEETPRIDLAEGSWGAGGDARVWLNADTLPLWRDIHDAETAFEAVARRAMERHEPLLDRVLRQAAREVLLLESSDWPFLVTHRSARDYAQARARGHAEDARRLTTIAARLLDQAPAPGSRQLDGDDEAFVAGSEVRDALFPDLDWRAGLKPRSTEPRAAQPAPLGSGPA